MNGALEGPSSSQSPYEHYLSQARVNPRTDGGRTNFAPAGELAISGKRHWIQTEKMYDFHNSGNFDVPKGTESFVLIAR